VLPVRSQPVKAHDGSLASRERLLTIVVPTANLVAHGPDNRS
jgi:hypothetical protein